MNIICEQIDAANGFRRLYILSLGRSHLNATPAGARPEQLADLQDIRRGEAASTKTRIHMESR